MERNCSGVTGESYNPKTYVSIAFEYSTVLFIEPLFEMKSKGSGTAT